MGRSWLAGLIVLMAMMAAAPAVAQNASPFAGKIVVVYLKSDPKAGAVLERVEVVSLGDRAFLVGSGVDLGDPAWAGLVQWIPVDDIGRIREFKDINELRARTRPGQ